MIRPLLVAAVLWAIALTILFAFSVHARPASPTPERPEGRACSANCCTAVA